MKVDLIEIHVVLKKPTTARNAERIGKRLSTALQIVARDAEKVESVYVADSHLLAHLCP